MKNSRFERKVVREIMHRPYPLKSGMCNKLTLSFIPQAFGRIEPGGSEGMIEHADQSKDNG